MSVSILIIDDEFAENIAAVRCESATLQGVSIRLRFPWQKGRVNVESVDRFLVRPQIAIKGLSSAGSQKALSG
jgi:hypothetical protein